MIMTKSKKTKVIMSDKGKPEARTSSSKSAGVVTTQSM
jgi:hypothetical protein